MLTGGAVCVLPAQPRVISDQAVAIGKRWFGKERQKAVGQDGAYQ
jgi:hypothetical protein